MNPSTALTSATAHACATADKGCGCGVKIDIHAQGDVHIHMAPCPQRQPAPAPDPAAAPKAKPKRSRATKLAQRAARDGVPSALLASSLHMIGRFRAGHAPSGALEERAFATLARLPSGLWPRVDRAITAWGELEPELTQRLAAPMMLTQGDAPLPVPAVARALGRELLARAGLAAFGDVEAFGPPTAGQVRLNPPAPEHNQPVRLCRIDNLRTGGWVPTLAPGELRPEEVAQECVPVVVDGQARMQCTVRTQNCIGSWGPGGVCMRVPEMLPSQVVTLTGVNFFSTDLKVRLELQADPAIFREVDALVYGDLRTPLRETVAGQERCIDDCRVQDRAIFTVPADLPPGVYRLTVQVPNTHHVDLLGPVLSSQSESVSLAAPPSARVQIHLDELRCEQETKPQWPGSDEVGLKAVVVELLPNMSTRALATVAHRFDDVDTHEVRRFEPTLLYTQDRPVGGLALALLAFEIDGEDAYERMVDSSLDVFVDLMKDQLDVLMSALAVVGGLKSLGKLGPTAWLAIAAAAAVVAAIDLIVALWAPADLLIDERRGLAFNELIELTNAAVPAPLAPTVQITGGNTIAVESLGKVPNQYRELRRHRSPDEGSTYALVWRFVRTT